MNEIIDAALSLMNVLSNSIFAFIYAINTPFLMTISFVALVRFVMMPLAEFWMDSGQLNKTVYIHGGNKLSRIDKEIVIKKVEKKVGHFLTEKEFAEQKRETVSGIDEFLK